MYNTHKSESLMVVSPSITIMHLLLWPATPPRSVSECPLAPQVATSKNSSNQAWDIPTKARVAKAVKEVLMLERIVIAVEFDLDQI